MAINNIIADLSDPPLRSDPEGTFSEKAENWVAEMSNFAGEMDVIIDQINSTSDDMDAAATASLAAANFEGSWSAGTYNTPSSVEHNDLIYVLNVASSTQEPGTGTDWVLLNIPAGLTANTSELNVLDGITATTAELNLVDGSVAGTIVNNKAVIYGAAGEVNATTLQVGGTAITATPAELNVLDGITTSTAELNLLTGLTASAAELNAAGAAGGTTSTAAELNLLDGSVAGTIVNSKAVIYGAAGEVNATTLKIAGNDITATAAELNILDGVVGVSAQEITYLANVTSDIQSQISGHSHSYAPISHATPATTYGQATTTNYGHIKIASNAEALGGTDTANALTSAALASGKSLATEGYYKLPGGLIIQWGLCTEYTNWSYPTPFTSAVYSIVVTRVGTGSIQQSSSTVSQVTGSELTQFLWHYGDNDGSQGYYIAIGR